VYDGLALATIVGSLLVGAWCLVAAARDRWIDLTHLIGLAAVALAVVVQAVIAVVRMAGGEQAGSPVTFVGYLITAVLLVPAGTGLSFMERTRWGSVIAGSASLITAVLVLRLGQLWG
jgi:hypothetical protein